MKLYFHPGTDMAQAMAETIGYVNRSRAFMPPGTVSPFVMRFDTGSVPVGYLVLSSETQTIGRDPGPGAVQGPADVRQPRRACRPRRRSAAARGRIVVTVDPDRLQSYGMSPDEVVAALDARATRSAPRATCRIGDKYADRAGQLDGRRAARAGQHPDPARAERRLPPRRRLRSRTPPTPRPATPWSTAGGRSTSWSPSGPTPRRSTSSTTSRRTCPRCRPCCPTTSRSASSSTSRPTSRNSMTGVALEGLLAAGARRPDGAACSCATGAACSSSCSTSRSP